MQEEVGIWVQEIKREELWVWWLIKSSQVLHTSVSGFGPKFPCQTHQVGYQHISLSAKWTLAMRQKKEKKKKWTIIEYYMTNKVFQLFHLTGMYIY